MNDERNMMKVSVAISTYNGEKYIIEQLDSLRLQTRTIDEVIIIDDCSSDHTVKLIKKYIQKNNLVSWKIYVNEENVGWKINFFNAINMSSGDIVFPCDQDDIWHKDKIEKMASIIENNDSIMVLEARPHKFFDDEEKLSEKNIHVKLGNFLDKLGTKKIRKNDATMVRQKKFSYDFLKRAPGCTLAVRKDFFNDIKSKWKNDMPHDALLTYFPNLLGVYYILDYDVIEWRQHVGSASRQLERSKKIRVNQLLFDRDIINCMYMFSKEKNIANKKIKLLIKAKKYNDERIKIVIERKIYRFPLLFRYVMFYPQYRRVITDLKYGIEK